MNHLSRVVCQIPGSTSNCGSGFDTLGLALSLSNTITVERADAPPTLSEDKDLARSSEMARLTVQRFFDQSGVEPFTVRIGIEGEVPQARGLGSSVTLRAGILATLSELTGADWSKDDLVKLVTELEGHPDNASASILGGFTVSRFGAEPGDWVKTVRIEIPDTLRFIVVSPEFEVFTSNSRGLLPEELPFGKAVASINNVSCMVAALATGDYKALRGAGEDFIHEPYRLEGIPGASAAIAAGVASGGYTGWLSGSGSSVLCISASKRAEEVAEAMQAAFKAVGLDSVARNLCADNDGLRIGAA